MKSSIHSRMRVEARRRGRAGFTLAAVLVVMASMLLMAVGVLAVVGIERKTARSFVDLKRAEWVAEAGMEELRAVLREETANDEFLIFAKPGPEPDEGEPLDYLYLARGAGEEEGVRYELTPLFSAAARPDAVESLRDAPEPATLSGESTARFETLAPRADAETAWRPVLDDDGREVGRFAYWVEDLQARVGLDGGGEPWASDALARVAWPHPAPGVPADEDGPGIEMALHALDPAQVGDADESELDERLVDGRELMVSPESALAASGFEPPLARDATGRLEDPQAAAIERAVVPRVRAYDERPLVPRALGIDPAVAGEPKLNLNRLLAEPRERAIDEIAEWIEAALPDFVERAGGFPEDYLRTLAAGALDYADADSDGTVAADYRGLDAHPLISEIFMQVHFRGLELSESRKYLNWTFRVYAELWNMSNQPVSGEARLSYENGLGTTGIGALPQGLRFDTRSLVMNPARCTHSLSEIDGRLWSEPIAIELQPDEYETREFIVIDYRMDVGPRFGPGSQFITGFSLFEPLGAAGLSLRWNDVEVDRVPAIVRDSSNLVFRATEAEKQVEAAIPGHSYGPYGDFVNNMGDPRIARYIRNKALGENAYPQNASPNRRNIRRGTIYDSDSSTKPKHYGRVLPSEWPDGGHDSPVGNWSTGGTDARTPLDPQMIGSVPAPNAGNAPQRISNAGRFLGATELGRVFDPVMWEPTYADLRGAPGTGAADTATLNRNFGPRMPSRRDRWPGVAPASVVSDRQGGGNTLRIGREEHGKFDNPRQHAARLLDLFHVGDSRSDDEARREGPVIRVDGRVNLNTAGLDALRVLAAGMLEQDPKLARLVAPQHAGAPLMSPRVAPVEVGTPTRDRAADLIAEAILRSRPFDSAYGLAVSEDEGGRPVFGNRDLYPQEAELRWSDAACEEVFARVYENSTLRSRNLRVWVVGQAIAPRPSGASGEPTVLAESRRVFTVFADPGERAEDGSIDETSYLPLILNENDF